MDVDKIECHHRQHFWNTEDRNLDFDLATGNRGYGLLQRNINNSTGRAVMEFFAVVGLIAVLVIIIGLAKESRRKAFLKLAKDKFDKAE